MVTGTAEQWEGAASVLKRFFEATDAEVDQGTLHEYLSS
jgi:hypothetical protein